MMASIRILKPSKDETELVYVDGASYTSLEKAQSDFNRLKRMHLTTNADFPFWSVDLHDTEDNLIESIPIDKCKADWLLKDFFKLRK